MNEMVLYPKKGTLIYLFVLLISVGFWLILLISLILEILMNLKAGYRDPYYGMIILFFIPIIIIGMYQRVGRYVILTDRWVSKPTTIKRNRPTKILYSDILWYMKKYSVQTDELNGVLIMTKKNKKIRYSDLKTPGCSKILIRSLEEKGIKERTPIKNIEKYH